jgi:hypothetical protein
MQDQGIMKRQKSTCVQAAAIKLFFIALCFCMLHPAHAQEDSVLIRFSTLYDASPVELGKKYPYKDDSVEVAALKFYISGIQFYQDNELVASVEKKHHLIDVENPASQYVHCTAGKNKKFNHIRFYIGVDSIANVSGALGGDLDPTNGMYWAWHSGYINFKLEGASNICPARKNEFTFHIGGYQYPYNAIQTVYLPVGNNNNVVICFDVKKLLDQIKLNELYDIMSPGEKAMEMAKKIAGAFSVTQ